jgi:hypothetical protein
MATVRLTNGAAEIITRLTAKLWQKQGGGQRPTYDETVITICSCIDDTMLDSLVTRYNAQNNTPTRKVV